MLTETAFAPVVARHRTERQRHCTRMLRSRADAVAIAYETVEIALLTAVRHLPPRQRACLVMRDVLRWSLPLER